MPHTADQYQRAAEEAKQLAAKATDSCVAGLHMERGMAERICSVPSRCFCARMRKAIEAGLESAPIGVINGVHGTIIGKRSTRNQRFVLAKMDNGFTLKLKADTLLAELVETAASAQLIDPAKQLASVD